MRLLWFNLFVLVLSVALPGDAASLKTRNVFLITTDGLRWQEVFTGAESALMNKTNGGVANLKVLTNKFWRDTPEARREALMPFLWSEIARRGQIFGNQDKGSVARIKNTRRFSYPGYNEFLTGAADARIDSNKKILNANTNVFEWLNTKREYKGRVAAVVNWDVIPWILNTDRSQIPVWTGFPLPPNSREINIAPSLQRLLDDTTPLWPELMILDSFTFHAALDYVKEEKPRAMYIAFGETDEWAHEGRYDYYLESAHHVDRFIKTLWETVQSIRQYRDKTTFIITTDHGRGSGPKAWKDHGEKIEGAENIWLAVIGPDTPALGERQNTGAVTQDQVAATVAAFLGEDFNAFKSDAGEPIREAMPRSN
jgi:hypothetical protein